MRGKRRKQIKTKINVKGETGRKGGGYLSKICLMDKGNLINVAGSLQQKKSKFSSLLTKVFLRLTGKVFVIGIEKGRRGKVSGRTGGGKRPHKRLY